MKSLKKGLSVLLSLVLCGSMVIPAFAAATFTDLQEAISGEGGSQEAPQGYAEDGNGNFGITAWTDSGTRHVELHEDVVHGDPAPSNAPDSKPGTYDNHPGTISVSGNVSIDTNKNTIDGNGKGGVFEVQNGAHLTVNAEEGGTIKGGDSLKGGAVLVHEDGSFEMNGGEMTGNKASDDHYNDTNGKGGAIYVEAGGSATLNNTTVTKNTATEGGGIYAEDGAKVDLTGKTEVSNNGDVDVYLDYGKDPGQGDAAGAQLTAPEDVVWTDTNAPEGEEAKEFKGSVDSLEEKRPVSLKWANPTTGGGGGSYGGGTDDVELEDPEVPLAEGPITCAEFIHKMWVLDGEPAPLDDRGLPEGVGEDHEFASAIAWAASAGIVSVDAFDAEALMTVALAREYLTNFAAYADMAMPELTTLTGKDSDLVMDPDGVLDEFFAEKDGR